jgi:threonine/homoserine/homoserine lactone efflux protein
MTANLTYITAGFFLGLTGLVPGPLLTLVISETLKHGTKEGIRVALSPLITDLPIILVTTLVMSRLADTNHILGFIAFGGSIFLIYLAIESFSFSTSRSDANIQASVIKKGVIANLLNPSPYLFWFTIGAPTMIKAFGESIITASLFIILFYSVLIGSKIVIAMVTGRAKNFLSSRYYIYLIRVLGIFLILFALYFLKNGLSYFDVI